MLDALLTILPVFGLISLGYLAARFRLVGERTSLGLSDFVFVMAIPCLLFRTLSKATIPDVQPWGYWLAYFIALGIVWLLATLIASRGFGRKGPELVVAGFAAAQANTVLVGIPIILKVVGEEAVVPLALLIGVHLPVTVTLATVLAEGRQASPLRIGKALITHPIVIGILAGSAARPFTGMIPTPAWQIVDALAGAAIPCALVALGMTLVRYGIVGNLRLPAILSALKLLLHPALVFVLAMHVFSMPPAGPPWQCCSRPVPAASMPISSPSATRPALRTPPPRSRSRHWRPWSRCRAGCGGWGWAEARHRPELRRCQPGRAQAADRGCILAFRQLASVRPGQEIMEAIDRDRQAEYLLQQAVDIGAGLQIAAAHDMGDGLMGIIERDRQMVACRRLAPRDHDIAPTGRIGETGFDAAVGMLDQIAQWSVHAAQGARHVEAPGMVLSRRMRSSRSSSGRLRQMPG